MKRFAVLFVFLFALSGAALAQHTIQLGEVKTISGSAFLYRGHQGGGTTLTVGTPAIAKNILFVTYMNSWIPGRSFVLGATGVDSHGPASTGDRAMLAKDGQLKETEFEFPPGIHIDVAGVTTVYRNKHIVIAGDESTLYEGVAAGDGHLQTFTTQPLPIRDRDYVIVDLVSAGASNEIVSSTCNLTAYLSSWSQDIQYDAKTDLADTTGYKAQYMERIDGTFGDTTSSTITVPRTFSPVLIPAATKVGRYKIKTQGAKAVIFTYAVDSATTWMKVSATGREATY